MEQSTAALIERSRRSYERDMRFNQMAQSCVAQALDVRGRVDPERADGDAYEIALLAVATLLQRIYEEDAELNALRAERDHYKKLALKTAHLIPARPLVVLKPDSASHS